MKKLILIGAALLAASSTESCNVEKSKQSDVWEFVADTEGKKDQISYRLVINGGKAEEKRFGSPPFITTRSVEPTNVVFTVQRVTGIGNVTCRFGKRGQKPIVEKAGPKVDCSWKKK